MKTIDIEIALMKKFRFSQNIVVPNVSGGYGLLKFETDLLILTPSGYATGIEIKVSKSDLKADLKKPQWKNLDKRDHYFKKIKHFWYAVPTAIHKEALAQIPGWCGLISVEEYHGRHFMRIIHQPKMIGNYKWSEKEMLHLAHLGAMRIFKYKNKIRNGRS